MADKWSLTEHKGYLRLHATKTVDSSDNFFKAANTIEQRFMSSEQVNITVKIRVNGMSDGQRAGLVNYNGGKDYALCGIVMERGVRYLYYDQNGQTLREAQIPKT
jgi:beta-xylosidase